MQDLNNISFVGKGDRLYATHPLSFKPLMAGQGARLYCVIKKGEGFSFFLSLFDLGNLFNLALGVVKQLCGRAKWIAIGNGASALVSEDSLVRLAARIYQRAEIDLRRSFYTETDAEEAFANTLREGDKLQTLYREGGAHTEDAYRKIHAEFKVAFGKRGEIGGEEILNWIEERVKAHCREEGDAESVQEEMGYDSGDELPYPSAGDSYLDYDTDEEFL